MDRDAFKVLLSETIEEVIKERLGVDFAGISEQFTMVNVAAQRAAHAELGGLLGLQGADLQSASVKLNDYVQKLAPHDRAQYDDPANLVSLWKSLSATDTTPPGEQAPETSAVRTYKRSEIEAMTAEEFRAQEDDIEQAYLSGSVVDDLGDE